MRAEKERVHEVFTLVSGVRSLKSFRPKEHVNDGESRVHDEVSEKYRQKEGRPGHVHQIQVRMELTSSRLHAPHVEGAISVNNPSQASGGLLCKTRIEHQFAHGAYSTFRIDNEMSHETIMNQVEFSMESRSGAAREVRKAFYKNAVLIPPRDLTSSQSRCPPLRVGTPLKIKTSHYP
jgi:hypothetical protein